MPNVQARISWLIIGATAVISVIFLVHQDLSTRAYLDNQRTLADFISFSVGGLWSLPRVPPMKVKGLYLTAYSAGEPEKIKEIITLIDKTELNGVVIDLKDYSGYVLYNSALDFVNQNKLKDVRIENAAALVKKLKRRQIYAIARISVFQDPLLAEKKPEWAVKSKKGGLWRDNRGLSWVDPTREEVWRYAADLAKEAAGLGFDEINFDYVRFPSDGRLGDIVYTHGGQKRHEVMGDFFNYISRELADWPVYLSADLFGLTTEKSGEDDMYIGQRFTDAVKYFDYVYPMVYPSHYPRGYLGYTNPAEHPYEVVYNAISSGVKRARGQRAKVRAWLQAFNLGAVYDGDKIRAQINAAQKAGADGWILWNAANRYTDAGLLAQ